MNRPIHRTPRSAKAPRSGGHPCAPSVTGVSLARFRCRGQAAIELIASLLLLMILITGIIHVNRMARTSLFLHSVLRGTAGVEAMESTTTFGAPDYISDWQPGADAQRYTADDQPVRNGARLAGILSSLTGHSVRREDDWSQVVDSTRLPVSEIQLYKAPIPAVILGSAHETETLHVPVDPVIRQLIYDKDDVAIKEEVWMPLMGGLY